MTIPGLLIINILLGASVAYCARIQIKNLQRPIFYNRYFTTLMLFQVILMLPVGIYYSGFYPDWSWMYLVDTRTAPTGLNVMALLGYPLASTMGYLVGYFSARSNADWVTIMLMSVLGVGLLGLLVVGWTKLTWLGTYNQFQNRINLVRLTGTSLLPSMLITWLGLSFCWGYVLFRFWREGHLTSVSTRN